MAVSFGVSDDCFFVSVMAVSFCVSDDCFLSVSMMAVSFVVSNCYSCRTSVITHDHTHIHTLIVGVFLVLLSRPKSILQTPFGDRIPRVISVYANFDDCDIFSTSRRRLKNNWYFSASSVSIECSHTFVWWLYTLI